MTPTATVDTVDTVEIVDAADLVETVDDGVLDDLLVEEVSIDGMCGVY
jgi:mycofactocin precursor